jgi:hypothetical protein
VHELATPEGIVATLAILGRCDPIRVLDAGAPMHGAAPAARAV